MVERVNCTLCSFRKHTNSQYLFVIKTEHCPPPPKKARGSSLQIRDSSIKIPILPSRSSNFKWNPIELKDYGIHGSWIVAASVPRSSALGFM